MSVERKVYPLQREASMYLGWRTSGMTGALFQAGLKRSMWPTWTMAILPCGSQHFVGFADGSGQRLFDHQVNAVGEESETHAVMKPSWCGDDCGVDATDQLAIVG